MNPILRKITIGLLYLLAIVFSLKSLLEPDLWWQLRTGEWMLETGSIPHTDPFSFTYFGTPWQNIKWGFEVIIALLSKTLGTEMLMMVQVICSIGIVYFLLRLAKGFTQTTLQPITYGIIGLSFIALEYRMTGRPETITHVFFLLLCAILLERRFKPSRFIWWIPVIMMVWANLHEAFGIGLVVLGVFTASAWFEARYAQTQSKQQAIQLTAVLGLSLLSICVNPNFFQILLKPLEIAGQVYENKYTSEFTTYAQPMFWTKEAWITLSVLVFVLVVVCLRFVQTKGKNAWVRLNGIIPLPLSVLIILLVYLASTGHRNIIFATLVLVPVCIPNLQWLLTKAKRKFSEPVVYGSTIVVFLFLYISIVSSRYYTFWGSKHQYGLEVPAYATPVGAANFLEQQKLTEKPVLSDYLTSSYLLWRLQPTFKTFIDLRDLDVFPGAHFDLFAQLLVNLTVFEKLDSQYHFNSVVLLRAPQMQTIHAYLYNHPTYRLSYLDAVCCVYVKDSSLLRLTTFNPLRIVQPSKTASIVTSIFNPLHQENDLSGMDEVLAASSYFYEVGDLQRAAFYAQQSVAKGIDSYKGLEVLGQLAYQQFLMDTTATKNMWEDSASYYFNKAYKLNQEYVPLLIDLGVKSFNEQQYKGAINFLEKACKLEPNNLKAHKNMAEVYKTQALQSNDPKKLELAIAHFNKADHINPNNPEIMMNLGFLYFRLGDCDHAVEFLEQIVEYPYITEVQRSRAKECIQKCK